MAFAALSHADISHLNNEELITAKTMQIVCIFNLLLPMRYLCAKWMISFHSPFWRHVVAWNVRNHHKIIGYQSWHRSIDCMNSIPKLSIDYEGKFTIDRSQNHVIILVITYYSVVTKIYSIQSCSDGTISLTIFFEIQRVPRPCAITISKLQICIFP